MARSTPVQEELGALQAELRKMPKSETRGNAESRAQARAEENAAPTENAADELEAQLSDLGDALSGYAGQAEDFIAKHPLVSVLTAFALGVAIGGLLRRD
ncbi:hypothetical protein [Microvirga terricola]|uniref:Membrane-anchored ribosome-binding protein, inhibits growth in stationary phase, ElaB/YqjD/DUF883 family n=1 Tax=Microvirga terricola TaxID=2719797 RepID=A0ABX0V948_9HYPH|nr:hypothetical protein [Microvirga terricola]NIX76375.1 hypothetical protein [Microvirga terricola]